MINHYGRKINLYAIFSLTLLILLPLLFLWRVAFLGDVLLSLDLLLTYEPWRSELPGSTAFPLWNELMADPLRAFYPVALYIQQSWQNGEIPFWYPYAGNNLPILATGYFQVLYPINNILWQFLPVFKAFGWSAILHLFMGSTFTFLFVRELGVTHFGRLVAAISFTYSSSLVIWLGLPFVLDSIVWLPFIFWALERAFQRHDWRWSLLAGLGVAIQILAGHIQLVMYTFTVLPLYAICRGFIRWQQERRLGWFSLAPFSCVLVALGVGGGLAAFQLIPLAELISTIRRGEGDVSLYNSPLALLRLLIPDLLGTNIDGLTMPGYRFEIYLYLGILPLFFAGAALFSKRAWLARCLVGLGIFFLLPIFNVPPFFQIFYYLYPTFPSLGLARIMYIIVFFWAVTAGIGADWLLTERPRPALKILQATALAIGGLALIYLVSLTFIAKYQARHFWNWPAMPDFLPSPLYHLSSIIFFLVFLGMILILLSFWANHRISESLFVIFSLALIIIDLFLAHLDFAPVLPKHMLYPVTPSLDFLQQATAQETQPFRLSGVGRTLWPNTGGVFSLPMVQVYDSFLSRRYNDYAEATGARPPSNFRVVTFEAKASPLLDALNVKYLYTPRDSLAAGDGVAFITEVPPPEINSAYAEAGQIFEWSINNWTQQTIVAPAPSALHYQGSLPGHFRLETALAIDPQFWEAEGVLFEIYATQPGQPPGQPLFSQLLQPRQYPEHRQWVPVEVDLSEFANQPLLISLVTKPADSPGTRGGWANPILVEADQWDLLYYGPNSIYRNKTALPRAWLVHEVTEVLPGDIAAAKTQLAKPDFDPTVEAIVEGSIPELQQPTSSAQPSTSEGVTLTHYHPAHVEISAELSRPGLLILSDLYYPGWRVYIDDQPQPLLAVNLAMRGVYLEPGQHTVVFSYEPQSFRWGLYISGSLAIGLVLVLGLSWFIRSARR